MPLKNVALPASNQNSQPSQPGPENVGLKLAAIRPQSNPDTEGSERRTKSGKFTLAQLRQTDGIVPLQSGTNQFDSQRGMTGFGMPRDVKGKHLKRIWELEFPEEAVTDQLPVNLAPQQFQNQQYQQQPSASAPVGQPATPGKPAQQIRQQGMGPGFR
ncbi:calponin family repeat domain-containing protein [Ditylenchus destructor]|nr:calponin family repeat domain-containing protein [Ditylenchus destructor]